MLDGDTLEVTGKRVRLSGIDAPELDQTCDRSGSRWACGQAAKAQLSSMVSGKQVRCRGETRDVYSRLIAVCTVGYLELNKALVEDGWAVVYGDNRGAYLAEEARAKASRTGIWGSAFMQPSEYREAKSNAQVKSTLRSTGASRPAQRSVHNGACNIKGNRNRRGQWIYHLPGMPYYDRTRPEEIFCTEEQAVRAGYRRAIVVP